MCERSDIGRCPQKLLSLAELAHPQGDVANQEICLRLKSRILHPPDVFVQIPRNLRRPSLLSAPDKMVTKERESVRFLQCVFWRIGQLDCARQCFARVRRALSLVSQRGGADYHLKVQFAQVPASAHRHFFDNVERSPEVLHGVGER